MSDSLNYRGQLVGNASTGHRIPMLPLPCGVEGQDGDMIFVAWESSLTSMDMPMDGKARMGSEYQYGIYTHTLTVERPFPLHSPIPLGWTLISTLKTRSNQRLGTCITFYRYQGQYHTTSPSAETTIRDLWETFKTPSPRHGEKKNVWKRSFSHSHSSKPLDTIAFLQGDGRKLDLARNEFKTLVPRTRNTDAFTFCPSFLTTF